MSKPVGILLFVVLALVAVAFRSAYTREVVFPEPGHVRLLDTDSYFHLRHAGYAMRHFPHLNRFDSSWEYPKNNRTDGAGLFDIGLAALTLATGGADEQRLMVTAAWYPVLILIGVLIVLQRLARRFVSRELSLWVVAAFLMYPALALPVSSLGYCDHHVAEILIGLSVVLAFVRQLEGADRKPPSPGRSLGNALPLIVFFFTWIGAPLFVPILALAALAVLTADAVCGDDGPDRHRAPAIARFALGVFVPVALIAFFARSMMMEARALRYGLIALVALATMGYLHRFASTLLTRRGWTPRARGLSLAALFVGTGLAAIVGTPVGRQLAGYLLTPKSQYVSEHASVGIKLASTLLGVPGLLALVGLPSVVASARDPRQRLVLVPVTCGLVLTGLWAITHDYGYHVSAFSALLAGLTVHTCSRWVPAQLRKPKVARVLLLLAIATPLLGLSALVPPWMPASVARKIQNIDRGWEQAMAWLRTGTPASGMPAEDQPEGTPPGPAYGVGSAWDHGNLIGVLGQRRAVWSRYPQPRSARFFTDVDEPSSIRNLYRRADPGDKVRYVVIDAMSVSEKFITWVMLAGRSVADYLASASVLEYGGARYKPASYGAPWRHAVSVRLYYLDGEDLEHYRLVYESPDRSCHYFLVSRTGGDVLRVSVPLDDVHEELKVPKVGGATLLPAGIAHDVSIHSTVKVFEIVEGAVLKGHAKPGTPVEVLLEVLTTSTMRRFRKFRSVTAGPDGVFAVRVPYASTGSPAEAVVRATDPYRVRGQDGAGKPFEVRVDVSEQAVLQGAVVDVPVTP